MLDVDDFISASSSFYQDCNAVLTPLAFLFAYAGLMLFDLEDMIQAHIV